MRQGARRGCASETLQLRPPPSSEVPTWGGMPTQRCVRVLQDWFVEQSASLWQPVLVVLATYWLVNVLHVCPDGQSVSLWQPVTVVPVTHCLVDASHVCPVGQSVSAVQPAVEPQSLPLVHDPLRPTEGPEATEQGPLPSGRPHLLSPLSQTALAHTAAAG